MESNHFWAKMDDGKIAVVAKQGERGQYYICGPWENEVTGEFEIIEEIKLPTGYTISDLYY